MIVTVPVVASLAYTIHESGFSWPYVIGALTAFIIICLLED